MTASIPTDPREALLSTLALADEPGASELCEAFGQVLSDAPVDGPVTLERIQPRTYRFQVGSNGTSQSFVLKRFDPWVARRAELVARRWLPALGLADRCAALFATAADRCGTWAWHVYEDLGNADVDPGCPDAGRVAAVMELLAALHTRAARHPVVPECRRYCGSLGAAHFTATLRDAIAVLEELAPPRIDPTLEQRALRDGLLARLYRLREEVPRRARLLETLGGPETLLHGDPGTRNAFVTSNGCGPKARLAGWDHAAVGPVSYDLSTFLSRFPKSDRPWILEAYRCAVAREDWYLPPARDLNAMFETAEYARYADRVIWPAVALLEERAPWAWSELAQVERWLDTLEPVLPEP
jgi:hypothetical protein